MLIYDLNANPLNSNEWAFPLTECFHIVSFALSIGTIVLVDLHLLGWALKRQTSAQILRHTELWTLVGLIVVIISGLMIFSSDPIRYAYNFGFQFKMTVLLLAILFNYTVHRKVAKSNASPGVGALVAAISLFLWVLVPFGGIWISFV